MKQELQKQFVVFDIFGDWAHFKKPMTTMSPQSYSIPTGTAIIGMISAILGLDKNSYWDSFSAGSYELAMGVVSPIQKTVIPFNTLKVENKADFYNISARKQTNIEYVQNCRYRIWFSSTDENLMSKLETYIKNHFSEYTVSLGQAWTLANFSYVNTIQISEVKIFCDETTDQEEVEIQSIVPKKYVKKINFQDRHILSQHIPIAMKDNSRELIDIQTCFFDMQGRSVKGLFRKYYTMDNGDHIVCLQ